MAYIRNVSGSGVGYSCRGFPTSSREKTRCEAYCIQTAGTSLFIAFILFDVSSVVRKFCTYFFYPHGATFPNEPGPPYCRGFTITPTPTYHTRWDCGRVISPTQRSLPDNTQHSQETDIHASSGIRTRNPSNRATADLRLGRRGDWDRLVRRYRTKIPDRFILNVILKGAFY